MINDKMAMINHRDENTAPLTNTVADACMRKLCQTFRELCPPPTPSPLSNQLDDITRACLLMADEWGAGFPASTLESLAACRDKVSNRYYGRYESLSWRLSLELCRYDPDRAVAIKELTTNLDHNNSSIRLWMYDLAWSVRHRLNPVEVSERLLKNVADTLGYWDSALGLCGAMFQTEKEFLEFAHEFQPEDFADQYQARLDLARQQGLSVFQQRFERLELRLHRIISEYALDGSH